MAAELKGWMEIGERVVWAGDDKIALSFQPALLAVQHLSVQLGSTLESIHTAGSDAAVAQSRGVMVHSPILQDRQVHSLANESLGINLFSLLLIFHRFYS